MKYGLKDSVIEKITCVFGNYSQVTKVVLYGSRAKGNYKNGSDIDLVLYGDSLTLRLINRISNEIDDLLLPYKIDLSIFHQISNDDLIEHIKRVGIVFFEKHSV